VRRLRLLLFVDDAWGATATATVQLGAFNGEGAHAIAHRDSTAMFVGRVTARPLPQLSLGARGIAARVRVMA